MVYIFLKNHFPPLSKFVCLFFGPNVTNNCAERPKKYKDFISDFGKINDVKVWKMYNCVRSTRVYII